MPVNTAEQCVNFPIAQQAFDTQDGQSSKLRTLLTNQRQLRYCHVRIVERQLLCSRTQRQQRAAAAFIEHQSIQMDGDKARERCAVVNKLSWESDRSDVVIA